MLTCASFPRCIEHLQGVRDSARHPTSVFAPLSHYSARVQVTHPRFKMWRHRDSKGSHSYWMAETELQSCLLPLSPVGDPVKAAIPGVWLPGQQQQCPLGIFQKWTFSPQVRLTESDTVVSRGAGPSKLS